MVTDLSFIINKTSFLLFLNRTCLFQLHVQQNFLISKASSNNLIAVLYLIQIFYITGDIPGHNFSNPKQYNIRGVKNFYVNVDQGYNNITLGVWHVLPEGLVDVILKPEDYEEELMKDEYPVIVFLHGNNNVRTDNVAIYRVLRKYFHVIACDYRGTTLFIKLQCFYFVFMYCEQ